MFTLPSAVEAAAVADDAAAVAAWVDAVGDAAAATARTAFQRRLIHVATEAGSATTLAALLARPAFRRRDSLAALDYGALRRTALHHACARGHVRCVELLVGAGADPALAGRSTASLFRGVRCGALVNTDAPPAASPAAVAANDAVRLALDAPPWSRGVHGRWPAAFRDAVAELVRVNARAERRGEARLDRDTLDLVCGAAAYPVSAWV